MNLIPPKKDLDNVNISINRLSIEDFTEVKYKWHALEQESEPQFFLSAKWILPWLQQILPNKTAYLMQVEYEKDILALGIFVETKIRRNVFIHSTQWHLHRTGVEKFDQIWIENNNFLINTHYKKKLIPLIWYWLESNINHVDEFVVNLHKDEYNHALINSTKSHHVINTENENGFFINLEPFSNLENFLASTSRNTRQKINKSIKLLKEQGDLNFAINFDAETQIEIINKTKQWHIKKWQHTSTPSGFLNPLFVQFHQLLIKESNPEAKSFVVKLSLNTEIIACLYGFIQRDTCYFYLSNIKPINDNRIKLGLTLHCFLIDHLTCNMKNIVKYDFLAGASQYKKSLSNGVDNYSRLIIQRKCFQFIIEKKLKTLKTRLIKLRQIFH